MKCQEIFRKGGGESSRTISRFSFSGSEIFIAICYCFEKCLRYRTLFVGISCKKQPQLLSGAAALLSAVSAENYSSDFFLIDIAPAAVPHESSIARIITAMLLLSPVLGEPAVPVEVVDVAEAFDEDAAAEEVVVVVSVVVVVVRSVQCA